MAVALLGLRCLAAVTRRIEHSATRYGSTCGPCLVQRLGQSAHTLAGPTATAFADSPLVVGWWFRPALQDPQPMFGSFICAPSCVRPPDGPEPDGSSLRPFPQTPPWCAAHSPVAIATAAMHHNRGKRLRRRTRLRRAFVEKTRRTVENRSRMGSTSITTTTYGMKTVFTQYYSRKSRFDIS